MMDRNPCELCHLVEINWHNAAGDFTSFVRELFHPDCDRCASLGNPQKDPLCPICDHMKLNHLIACGGAKTQGNLFVAMGSLDQMRRRQETCGVCQVLVHAILTYAVAMRLDIQRLETTEFELQIHNSVLSLAAHRYTRSILPPIPITAWCRQPDPKGSKQLVQNFSGKPPHKPPFLKEYVDWGLVRSWIDEDSAAKYNCQPTARPLGLKLIDVRDGRVVTAPSDCTYLALSYVFGSLKAIKVPESGQLRRRRLPFTIRDAISACAKLGFRYLWIDQLCINQRDDAEKQQQISQMDRIYMHAAGTLVAVEGQDSHYGLPGVTSPREWIHAATETGEAILGNLAPSPVLSLKHSRWTTRGWTLQEAMCSRKLLLFSEFGVHCCWAHDNAGLTFVSETSYDSFDKFTFPSTADYWQALEQYRERKLTSPSDILNAFAAVQHAIHGDDTYHGLELGRFDRAILWRPKDSEVLATPARQQQDKAFPSWSWASYPGTIDHLLDVVTSLALVVIPDRPDRGSIEELIRRPAPGTRWQFPDFSLFREKAYKIREPIPQEKLVKRNMATIAVAWQAGCIPSPFPVNPSLDSRTFDALTERWPTYTAFWQEAFESYTREHTLFSVDDYRLASSQSGRMLIHGQIAQLYTKQHRDSADKLPDYFLYTHSGLYSGEFYLSHAPEKTSLAQVECLCLSIALGLEFGRSPDVVTQLLYNDKDDNYVYRDSTGEICPSALRDWTDQFVVLNVMLIERERHSQVARRLGVGQVFLKRWVKAEPQFQTIILE